MIYLEKRLNEVIGRGEGILSVSLAPNGVRDFTDLLYSTRYLVEAGMDQLLLISHIPDVLKLSDLAPAEQTLVLEGLKDGGYNDMFFDNAAAVRKEFPELPIIATPMVGDMLGYGMGRFIKKAAGAGVNGWDTANYPAIPDPLGCRAMVEAEKMGFICAIGTNGLDIDNPVHRKTVEDIVRVSSGELFLVPAQPGTANSLSGRNVKAYVDLVRDFQEKYRNTLPLIGIGGISTPADAYEMVRVAGVDGVHFSSAYMKRRFRGESKEEIQAWLRAVKDAMRK